MASNGNLKAAKTQVVGWLDVPRATAILVLAALAFLILVRRGFRGVNINLG